MSLYKFHTFNENSVSALEAYSAWFSKPTSFNDPFEGLYKEIVSPLNDEQMTEMRRYLCELVPSIKNVMLNSEYENDETMAKALAKVAMETFRSQQNNFYESGICCFISDERVIPYEEPLMWGHYGNGLKGYILQFDNDLDNIFEDEKLGAIPVEYNAEPPTIHCHELLRQQLKTGSSADDLLKVITTKSKEWEYENEIRFMSYKNGNKLFKYKQGAVKSIIVGSKMPQWQKMAIKAIAERHQISDIQEAFAKDDSYKVGLRALSL